MSYQIRYGNEPKPAREHNRRLTRNRLIWLAVIIPCLLGVLWPQGRQLIHQLLFPWVDDTLISSIGTMLTDIRAGEAVPAAFLEFCREVIGSAGIPI